MNAGEPASERVVYQGPPQTAGEPATDSSGSRSPREIVTARS